MVRTPLREFLSLLSLRETRRGLREARMRWVIMPLAVSFALVSMILGRMLEFYPSYQPFSVTTVWVNYGNPIWWNYPALVILFSQGDLILPFLATVTMVLVSAGVALGGATGLTALRAFVRARRLRTKAAGPAAAATSTAPAVGGLATLGACCCTSCAGLAAVAVVAGATGTSLSVLRLNTWYIDLFQLVVVGVSLLAQEHAMRADAESCDRAPMVYDRRSIAGVLLRFALLMAGLTWALATFIEMAQVDPSQITAALWYHWLFEHTLLSLVAVYAGLFPRSFVQTLSSAFAAPRLGPVRRGVFGLVGFTWAVYVPPFAVGWGLGGGTGNEVLGYLGATAASGAVSPGSPLSAALLFHWTFQHLLLGGFALALAGRPEAALDVVRWTFPRPMARSSRRHDAELNGQSDPEMPTGPPGRGIGATLEGSTAPPGPVP